MQTIIRNDMRNLLTVFLSTSMSLDYDMNGKMYPAKRETKLLYSLNLLCYEKDLLFNSIYYSFLYNWHGPGH